MPQPLNFWRCLRGVLPLLMLLMAACGSTATTTATLSSPTAMTSQKPSPTPTRALVTGATLGGPDSAFQTKYGRAADDLWDINGVTFSTNLDAGADGQQHVFEMLVYKTDATTWTQAEAQPICTAFLPPDATHQRDTQDSRGDLEQVYMSALLAVTFPPASSVSYDPTGAASITYEIAGGGVFQCRLSTLV